MSARWWTLVVWALAAASALFWGLRLVVAAPPPPPHTEMAELGVAARGDLTRLLGADAPAAVAAAPAEPPPDARFQLIGVVAARSPQAAREGLALIAVDGKPPKAYRVGAVVDGQQVLKSVSARGATLGLRDSGAVVALDIAAPPAAATGTLPGAAAPAIPAQAPALGVPGVRPGALPQRGQFNPLLRRQPPPVPPAQDAGPPQSASPPPQDGSQSR